MFFYRIITPGLSINSYLIADPLTKEGIVIDPVRNIDPLLKLALKENITITTVLETHVHADFISGSKELKHHLKGVPTIYCSGLGGVEWCPRYADQLVKDREEIGVGALRLQAWHTPGHTPEHLTWVVYEETSNGKNPFMAMTGDFLFVGSVGRPDLLGEENTHELMNQLYDSVFKVLPQLPDYIEIFPAHGAGSLCGKAIGSKPSSTLGFERVNNPMLVPRDRKDWEQALLRGMPMAPPYFKRVKNINVKGATLLDELQAPIEITLHQMNELDSRGFILDTRSQDEFAARHVRNSINIPLGPLFNKWVPEIIPADTPLYILVQDHSQLPYALDSLRLVGLDHLAGFAIGSDHAFAQANHFLHAFPIVSPEFVAKKKEEGSSMLVLDVRTSQEWENGHIQDALHIPLSLLAASLEKIPKDTPINVTCGSGYRASIAASILKKAGYLDVSNVRGGMQEWVKSQLPITV